MKEEILIYLKTDRSYERGVSLYVKYGIRLSFKRQLNVQPKSKMMHEMLLEEFRMMIGMDTASFNKIINTPVQKKAAVKEEPEYPFQDPTPETGADLTGEQEPDQPEDQVSNQEPVEPVIQSDNQEPDQEPVLDQEPATEPVLDQEPATEPAPEILPDQTE